MRNPNGAMLTRCVTNLVTHFTNLTIFILITVKAFRVTRNTTIISLESPHYAGQATNIVTISTIVGTFNQLRFNNPIFLRNVGTESLKIPIGFYLYFH